MDKWVSFFEKSNRSLFNQALRSKLLIDLVMQHTPANGRILEPGCGTALLSQLLADCGYDVTALDLSEDVVRYAQERCLSRKSSLTFMTGDILKLGELFPAQSFDTVCHSGVMEHFSDEHIVKGLSEQRIVSKRVIFAIPNSRNKPGKTFFGDERFLNERAWVSLIRQAGFGRVEVIGGDSFPSWMYLLPHGVFVTPRTYWAHTKPGAFKLASRLLFWRKYVSKHFIFICEP